MRGFHSLDNFALGIVFAHLLVEQVRHEVVAVLQLARHACLHVDILYLALQFYHYLHLALGVNLLEAGLGAGLGDEHVAVPQGLGGIYFILLALVSE